MTKENNEKVSFLKRAYLAIKDFEYYGVFGAENVSTAIKYLLKIMLIFVIIIAGIFIYQFHTYFEEGLTYFKDHIEELHFIEGKLEINQGEKIEIQNDHSILPYIAIDTDANEEEIQDYTKKISGYETGILILEDKIVYKNELLSQAMEYHYKDIMQNYAISQFDKQGVLDFVLQIDKVSLYISIFIVMTIYLYIIYLASTFIDVVMLAVLGFIVGRIAGIKIRFKATFNIGIYALTLPLLLNLIYIVVNSLTGFTVQYFSWMYTTISYIYVIVAILMIKADFINKQAELMKIIEEQERVRQEMKLREEQKKQEETKNENKDNKDKEEDKKEEKKKTKKKEKETGLSDDRISTTGSNWIARQQIK